MSHSVVIDGTERDDSGKKKTKLQSDLATVSETKKLVVVDVYNKN